MCIKIVLYENLENSLYSLDVNIDDKTVLAQEKDKECDKTETLLWLDETSSG